MYVYPHITNVDFLHYYTMLLAQLLGLYFIIVGVLVLYRQKSVMPALTQLSNNRPLIIVIGFVELLAGLAVVLTYPALTMDWMGLISVIGWMLIVEGIIYLALPYGKVHKMIRSFNTPTWFRAGSLLAIVIGAYLAGIGFGFIQ